MQSYLYVLGSVAGGGGEVRVCEKEGKCAWFVRRWGMSARIAKPSIAQDSYQSALGWGDYYLLPSFPLPLTTSSRKESSSSLRRRTNSAHEPKLYSEKEPYTLRAY